MFWQKCNSENISAIIAWPKNFADSETHGTGLQVAVHIDEFEDGSVGISSHSNLHQCLNEPNLTTSLQSGIACGETVEVPSKTNPDTNISKFFLPNHWICEVFIQPPFISHFSRPFVRGPIQPDP